MSDFLGRLISRARGASTAEPILSSRYEAPLALETTPVVDATTRRRSTNSVEYMPPVSANQSQRDFAPHEEPEPETGRLPHDFPPDDRDESAQPDRTLSPIHPVLAHRQPIWPEPAEVAASTPDRLGPRDSRDSPEPPVIVGTVVEKQKPGTSFFTVAALMEDLPVTVRRGDERAHHAINPSAPATKRHHATLPVEPQPVEVQVTIGHIEVRAAAPVPTASPRIAGPHPGLSLDDYLRRRNGAPR